MAALTACAVALSVLVTPPPVYAAVETAAEGVPAGTRSSDIATDTEIADAVADAAATGENVEIDSLATPDSEVYAAPDGTFIEDIAVTPYQALTDDGVWAPIDNTLVNSTSGTLVPANSDSGLELSGGGNTTVARITDIHDRTVAYTWFEDLPTPTVAGEVATYAEVLPGVDLKIRATNDGFAKVFEVKTAAAAASAAVASIELGIELDGFTAAIGETGALEISDLAGNIVYGGPTPLMWDATPADEGVGDSAPIDWAPSTFALSAAVGTSYADGTLTLTPDAAMLANPDAVYPIRIDPKWVTVDRGAWALASDYSSYRNHNYYNGKGFEKDKNGTARLGRAWDDYVGDMEQTWRLAFEFNTAKFRGKDVLEADLYLQMTYSWVPNCSDVTPSYGIYKLDANLTKWTWNNNGTWGGKIATRDEGVGSSCAAPRDIVTDVTDYVQETADSSDKVIQFGLKVSDEDACCNSFRRFGPEKTDTGSGGVHLSVKYNTPPNKPGSLTIDGQSCASGSTVKLGASVSWTASATFGDAEGDNINGYLQWTDQASGTVKTWETSAANKEKSNWTVPRSSVTGQTYRAVAYAKDGTATGPSAGGCTVLIDTTPPVAPTVASTDYPADGVIHGSIGKTGRFKLQSSSSDTAGYKWSLQAATDAAPTSGKYTVPAPALGKGVTLTFDPPISGTLTLYAWAYDAHGNTTTSPTKYTFLVGDSADPVAHWKLDEAEGTTAADEDYAYEGNVNRPLTITGPAWAGGTSADAANHRANYLAFDGTDDTATTTGPVINTNVSYTVSAWVRIQETDVDYSIVSQDGNVNSGFMLKYDGESHKFLFVTCNVDSNASGSGLACPSAGSANVTAEADVWYNVTGVYNYTTKKISLYVNGQLQESTTVSVFDANGKFVLGRDLYGGANTTYFAGDIDEVKVWDRVVATGEIQRWGQRTEGIWDFESVNTANFPNQANSSNRLAGTNVELVEGYVGQGLGLKGSGAASTATATGPVIDTSGDFTVSAWVKLDTTDTSANLLSVDGTYGSPFHFGYLAGSGHWRFSATSKDASGYTWNSLEAPNPVVAGKWTHIAVTYQASGGAVDLYIDGAPAAHKTGVVLWKATGSLRVGSVLYQGAITDYWTGAIDNVTVATGVLDKQQEAVLADANVRETHSELVSGDFDGDGDADALSVVNEGERDSAIYAMENDGAGGFTRTQNPVLRGTELTLLEEFIPEQWRLDDALWRAGDINGDGCDDLVIAVPGTSQFQVTALRSIRDACQGAQSDGSWFNTYDYSQTSLPASEGWTLSETQIQLTDITGDEADDLVMLRSDSTSAYSTWVLSLADGRCTEVCDFASPVAYGTGTGDARLIELAAADFDDDRWGDVVEIRTGADGSADMYIRYGSAEGLGAPDYALDTPTNWDTDSDRVTVADVTGDDRPDLVASYRFSTRIRLQVVASLTDRRGFAANDDWGYSARCTGCATDLTSWAHTDLAGGDVDGDGTDDLFTLRAGSGGEIGALWTRESIGDAFAAAATPTWADPATCFGVEGDVNGDGYRDAVVPRSDYDAAGLADSGAFWFVDGATGNVSMVTQNTAGVEGAAEVGDLFGYAVATYDENSDGCADIVAGAPGENAYGYAHVIHGSPSGIDASADYMISQGTLGFPGKNEDGDQFGFSIAATNLTEGTPVLIVGVPGEDVQIDTTGTYRDGDTGIAEIVNGGAMIYVQGDSKAWIDQNTWGSTTAVETGDSFGYSLAATPTRFVTGIPLEDIAATDDGSTFVFNHSISAEGQPGLLERIDQGHAVLADGASPEASDRLGHTVAAVDYWPAGTTLGTVHTRFAISTPLEDVSSNTVANAGMVSLINLDSAGAFTLAMNYIQGNALGDTPETSDSVSTELALYNLDPAKQASNTTLQLVIGVPDEDKVTSNNDGIVHITGAAVPTSDIDTIITDPGAIASGKFGTGLGCTATGLYITTQGTGTLNRFAWSNASAASTQTATAIAT